MPARPTCPRRTTVRVAAGLAAFLTASGCGTDPEERYAATLDGVCADVRSALTAYADAATSPAKDGGGLQRLTETVQQVAQTFTRGASGLRDANPPGAFAAFNASTADGLQTAGTRLREVVAAPAAVRTHYSTRRRTPSARSRRPSRRSGSKHVRRAAASNRPFRAPERRS